MTNEREERTGSDYYAADEPATIEQLAKALGEEKLAVQASLDELVASYACEERGIEIRKVAGGTNCSPSRSSMTWCGGFIKSLRPPLRLSMAGAGDAGGDCVQAAGDFAGDFGDPRGEYGGGDQHAAGQAFDYHGGTERSDGAADPLQDFERVFAAVWIERFGRVAELEGV